MTPLEEIADALGVMIAELQQINGREQAMRDPIPNKTDRR